MIVAVLAGIFIALCWGIAGTVSGKGARASDAASATAWGAIGGAILLVPFLIILGGSPPSGQWLTLAIITSISTLMGNLFLFSALKNGPIAIVAPIAALYGIEAAIFSIIIGENISLFKMLAFALVILGMILIITNREEHDHVIYHPKKAVIYSLLASLCLGLGLVGATKVGHEIGPLWMLGCVEFLGALLFGLPLLIKKKLSFNKTTIFHNSLGSVITSFGYITYIIVSNIYGIAIPAVIASCSCVISALVGIHTLKEKVNYKQVIGAIFIALAIALLSLGI